MDSIEIKKINSILDGYKEQMTQTLLKVLSYNSICMESSNEAPFGLKIKEALDYVLDFSKSLGLKTENFYGYTGIIDYGVSNDPQDMIGILSHIDIVPAGDGWTHNPFGEIENGIIYGRGAEDDKGPMIACIYAMKAIKESGIPLRKTIRHIIGTDEETGFRGILKYLEHHEPPHEGFTPDASFPLIFAEKGIAHFGIKAEFTETLERPMLQIKSGTAQNIIPNRAEAFISYSLGDINEWQKIYDKFPEKSYISFEKEEDFLRIKATGKSAHASTPEQGENAIDLLLQFINTLSLLPDERVDFIKNIYDLAGKDIEGKNFGISGGDEFGKLTMAITQIELNSNKGTAWLDIRFPVKGNALELKEKILKKISPYDLYLVDWHAKESLYVPLDKPLIKKLMNVYQDVTGDTDSKPLSIGGGTYARVMKNFVGFGPNFPGKPSIAHQAEEKIAVDDLLLLSKIYAQAMYQLTK